MVLNIFLVYYLRVGIDGILYSSFIITLISCAYGTYYYRKQLINFNVNFNWNETRYFLSNSLPFIPNVLSFWLMNGANRWILLNYSGIDEVGIYSAAARVTTVFEPLLMDPFMSVYLPVVFTKFRSGIYEHGFLWRIFLMPVIFVILGFGFQLLIGKVVVRITAISTNRIPGKTVDAATSMTSAKTTYRVVDITR